MIRSIYSRRVVLTLAIATAWYAAIWVLSQGKLIYTDEVAFAQDIARIAQGDWQHLGIPHPPLYIWLAGLAVRIFGFGLPAIRSVGALAYVATLLIIPAACDAFFKENTQHTALIAIATYAVHPLALQGSLLLDIDNTIFTPALLLFLTALAIHERFSRAGGIALIAVTYALMLWTKLLPSSLIISIAVAVIYAWRRRGFASVIVGMAFGLAVFAGTFALMAALTNFPYELVVATFRRTSAPVSGGVTAVVTRGLMGGGITASWIGIPFVLVYLYLLAPRAVDFLRTRRVDLPDILILSSATGMALYTIGSELPMGYPRYHYPMFALMVLLVSQHLAKNRFGRRTQFVLAGAAAAAVVYFAVVMPDPLLPQYALTFDTNSLAERLTFGLRLQVGALLIPLGVLGLGSWLALRDARNTIRVTWVAFCLGAWFVLTVAQVLAPYATIYEYGRVGAAQAGDLVRARTKATDNIVAPMEILFASHRPGDYVLNLVCPDCTAEKWLSEMAAQAPAAYVLTFKEDGRYTQVSRNAQVQALLTRCYTEQTVGSYLVYLRSGATCGASAAR